MVVDSVGVNCGMAPEGNGGQSPRERENQELEEVEHRNGKGRKGCGLLRKTLISGLLKKLRRSPSRDKHVLRAKRPDKEKPTSDSTQNLGDLCESRKNSRNSVDPAGHMVLLATESQLTSAELIQDSISTVGTDEIQTVLQDKGESVAICLKGHALRRIGSACTPISTLSEDRLTEPVEVNLGNANVNAVLATAPQTISSRAKQESGILLRTAERATNARRNVLMKKVPETIRRIVSVSIGKQSPKLTENDTRTDDEADGGQEAAIAKRILAAEPEEALARLARRRTM